MKLKLKYEIEEKKNGFVRSGSGQAVETRLATGMLKQYRIQR